MIPTVARRAWAEQVLSLDIGVDTIVRAVDVETGAALLEQGAVFVAVLDLLAAEHVGDVVDRLLDGEQTRAELRAEGRQRLDRAVEYGPSDVQRIR